LLDFSFSSRFRTIESLKRISWKNTSPEHLARTEMRIFDLLKEQYQFRFVSIVNETQQIRTTYANLSSSNTPLVLVHGFGGGIGLWTLNLDQLSVDRPVYAFDLPGFARSSRPVFSLNPIEAEQQFVDMFEEWRIKVGLNRSFILLGHSSVLPMPYVIQHISNNLFLLIHGASVRSQRISGKPNVYKKFLFGFVLFHLLL
jgi:abhydrolase domain-containing protein 4